MIPHYGIIAKVYVQWMQRTKSRIIIADTILVIIVMTIHAVVYWSCCNLDGQELKTAYKQGQNLCLCVATPELLFPSFSLHSWDKISVLKNLHRPFSIPLPWILVVSRVNDGKSFFRGAFLTPVDTKYKLIYSLSTWRNMMTNILVTNPCLQWLRHGFFKCVLMLQIL